MPSDDTYPIAPDETGLDEVYQRAYEARMQAEDELQQRLRGRFLSPLRPDEGPQVDSRFVPIFQGPSQRYYDPNYGNAQLHLLARAKQTPDDKLLQWMKMNQAGRLAQSSDASFIQSMSAVPTGVVDPTSWLQKDEGDKPGRFTPEDLDRFHREQEQLNEDNRRRAMNEYELASSRGAGDNKGAV